MSNFVLSCCSSLSKVNGFIFHRKEFNFAEVNNRLLTVKHVVLKDPETRKRVKYENFSSLKIAKKHRKAK